MQVVRNGLVILLLAGVGYAVYTYVNKPEQTPPPGADTEMPKIAVQTDPLGTGAFGRPDDPASAPGRLSDTAVTPRTKGMTLDDAPAFTPSPSAAAGQTQPRDSIPPLGAAPSFEPPAEVHGAARKYESAAHASESAPRSDTSVPVSIENPPRAGKEVPAATGRFADAWPRAQEMLAAGRLLDAHALLTAWYGQPGLTVDEEARLMELLGQLAGTVIYSNTDHLLEPAYVVRENETLEEIAQKYKVPWQLLAKINGLADPKAIRAGDRLKVVPGPFHAVVDLGRKEVALVLRGHYAGRFPIVRTGVNGAQVASAAAGLLVKEKMNARGEHYVGLEDTASKSKIGIYAADDSAGGLKMPAESSIVLSPRDAEDLYDILTSHESTVAVAP